MNKKIFITLLVISLFLVTASYSFAANGAMNNAKNAVMNTENAIGNAAAGAKNAVVNGARSLTNGAATLGNDAMNATENIGNDAKNTVNTTASTLDNGNDNYTATRTATTNNGFLGMSDNTWTWLILGIVGISIVALVWYYGAQYEHKNYDNN